MLSKPLTVGSTGAADDTYQLPAMVNAVLGTKFKIVTGYPGGNDVSLALERGEVQGRCGWSWSSIKATRPDWIASKKIVVLVQMSLAKHPDLPDVPLIMDLAKNDEQRQIFKLFCARQVMGRPFLGPPGVPADRVAALRQAFDETVADKAFLDDAAVGKFEINPVSGKDLEALVKEVYQTPPEITKKAIAILKPVRRGSNHMGRGAQRREQVAQQRLRPGDLQRPVKNDGAEERRRRRKAERRRRGLAEAEAHIGEDEQRDGWNEADQRHQRDECRPSRQRKSWRAGAPPHPRRRADRTAGRLANLNRHGRRFVWGRTVRSRD